MKKFITILITVCLIFTACSDNKTNSDYSPPTLVSGKPEKPGTHISVPPPTPEPTPTPTPRPTIPVFGHRLTLEEVNEFNKLFYFSRKGEYPEIRAFFLTGHSFDSVQEFKPEELAEGMASIIYKGKFLDPTNPYLTYKDTAELEWLKQNRPENITQWDDIAAGKYRLARVPLEQVEQMLQKYMSVSYRDITGENDFPAYNNRPVFYVREFNRKTGVQCLSGYSGKDYINLYCEGRDVQLSEIDGEYKIVSRKKNYRLKEDVYEKNGCTVYDYFYRVKPVYLYEREQENRQFNEAIRVFNDYLKKEAETQHKKYGIMRYAIRDLTGDNVPELIYYRYGYYGDVEILSYINGEIKQLETPSFNYSDGGINILANNMVASWWSTTGGAYTFYTYKPDGSFTSLYLEIPCGPNYGFTDFNGKEISEEEYKKLEKWCNDLYHDTADIDFSTMYNEILY